MKNSVEPSDEAIPSRDYLCVQCGQVKPPAEYAAHQLTRAKKRCRACLAAYQRELRLAGYAPTGRNKRIAALSKVERDRHFCINRMLDSAKGNTRRRQQECSLTHADVMALWVKQDGQCALSGLTLQTTANSEYVASIDRLDTTTGYVPGNVRLVCWAVNRGRGTMSDYAFVELCREVVRCNDYPARE